MRVLVSSYTGTVALVVPVGSTLKDLTALADVKLRKILQQQQEHRQKQKQYDSELFVWSTIEKEIVKLAPP